MKIYRIYEGRNGVLIKEYTYKSCALAFLRVNPSAYMVERDTDNDLDRRIGDLTIRELSLICSKGECNDYCPFSRLGCGFSTPDRWDKTKLEEVYKPVRQHI